MRRAATHPSSPPGSTGRRRPTILLLAGAAVLAAVGVVAYLVWPSGNDGGPPAAQTSATDNGAPAPASIAVPSDLRKPGVNASGIYPDGWLTRDATLMLAGGKAAVLTIRGEVPEVEGQRLAVLVDGRQIGVQPTPSGPLDIELVVPPADANRHIELRFARAITLKPPDKRSAAAQLTSLAVRPLTSAPASVTLPGSLSRENVVATGIYSDGWVGRQASVVLKGGGAAELALRAEVPPAPKGAAQRLLLLVNDRTVLDEPVQPGTQTVRALLGASRGIRRVEIRWANAARISRADSRRLSARLRSIAIEPVRGPRVLRVPADLASANAMYSGIYADGWAQKDVRVVLSGGPVAALTMRTLTTAKAQGVDVLVNAEKVASVALPTGRETLRIPIVAGSGPRLVELRFARLAPVGPDDPRRASTLLQEIGVVPVGRSAPGTITIPADLGGSAQAYSGIYADGWAQQEVRLVLAGGPATMLRVDAQTLAKGQRVTVLLDGRRLGRARMPPGNDSVRVHVNADRDPRLLELRFERIAPIAANDPRPAATLLRRISLGRSRTSGATGGSSSSRLRAHLDTASEVPAQAGPGSGTFTATIEGATLHWRLRVADLSGSVVAAVIRVGSPGQVGPRLLYLCNPCTNDAAGTVRLTPEQISKIRSGGTYVNVGTARTPGGEVRGQLTSR